MLDISVFFRKKTKREKQKIGTDRVKAGAASLLRRAIKA